MTDRFPVTPEFSRPVRLEDIGPQAIEMDIVATAEERAALAERFSLQSIDGLSATVRLERVGGVRKMRLSGRLAASVVQTCVVTLEPVEESIAQDIDLLFERVPDGASAREIVLTTAEEAEPLEGDAIDVGEIVAEELALSLNPYPRRPDSELYIGSADDAAEAEAGPFEKLARLRQED